MNRSAGLTLAARFGMLQLNRIALCLCGLLAGLIGPTEARSLALLALLYGASSTAAEVARRRNRWRGRALAYTLLFLDVILIRLVIASGQDPLGPFSFMSFVHVVGAMSLLPKRVGLRLAFAHGMTAFIFTTLRVAGIFGAPISSDGLRDLSVSILGLLLVAVAAAVFGRAVEQEQHARRQEAEGLAALAQDVQDATDPDAIADLLVTRVTQTLPYAHAVVVRSSILGRPDGQTQLIHDPSTLAPELAAALSHASNVVVVPLGRADDRQGVAAFVWGGDESAQIPDDIVSLTERFCVTATSALRRVALQAQITRLATEDALTGLPNRRVFDQTLARQIAHSARYDGCFSLLVVDIDRFKAVNDTHGHLAGDAVLAHVGKVLADGTRESDLAARFGGEEFVILLPETSTDMAAAAAEKLRVRLGDGSGPLPMTVSVGVATFPTHGSAAEALFEAADMALYAAKEGGRNQVRVAESAPPATAAALV